MFESETKDQLIPTRLARHAQRMALVLGLTLSLTSCVDESACDACIDDQVELRIELIEMGLEPVGSLESREYYRGGCSQKIIALDRPCAPKYGRAIGAGLLVIGIAGVAWRRRGGQAKG
jgi:hypothetical protein